MSGALLTILTYYLSFFHCDASQGAWRWKQEGGEGGGGGGEGVIIRKAVITIPCKKMATRMYNTKSDRALYGYDGGVLPGEITEIFTFLTKCPSTTEDISYFPLSTMFPFS